MSNAQLLIELQRIDLDAMRLRKRLQELPERKALAELKAKADEVFAKSQQVSKMRLESEAEMNRLSDSDDAMVSKARDIEAEISQTTDYRMTTSLTRELEGIVKKRNKIEFDSAKIIEKLDRISAAEDQVALALAKLEEQMDGVKKRIETSESDAKADLLAFVTRRSEIIAALPQDLIEGYEAAKKAKNGIAIGILEGTHCSVCRVEFQKSTLQELNAGPEITKCPQCDRILVVEKGE